MLRPSGVRTTAATVVVGLAVISFNVAAGKPTELQWQWPADRVAKKVLTVRVVQLTSEESDLIGVRRSPSLVSNLLGAVRISGSVLGDSSTPAEIQLRMPKQELPIGLKSGDIVDLLMLDDDTCVGVRTGRR